MIRRYLAPRPGSLSQSLSTSFSSSTAGPSSRPFTCSGSSAAPPSTPGDVPRPRRKPKTDPWSTGSTTTSSSSPFRDLDPPRPRKRRDTPPVRLRAGLLSENKAGDRTGRAMGEALALRAKVVGPREAKDGSDERRPQLERQGRQERQEKPMFGLTRGLTQDESMGSSAAAAAAAAAAFGASSAATSAAGFGTITNDPMRRSSLISDVPEGTQRVVQGKSFASKYASVLDTWGREWRKVDITHPPRAVNKIPIKHEQYDDVVALRDAQTYKGRFFLARLKPGRLKRTGPFTDMQRMYRGKLGLVLEAQQKHRAAIDAAVAVGPAAPLSAPAGVSPEIVGLTPESSRLASSSASTSASTVGGPQGALAGLGPPPPRAPTEPSISLTIVANKLRVSKFAVERRHAINRLRAAWTHVISHSPVVPISTEHCYFLHVADGKVYDSVDFRQLCEEAERAITSLARAIIARENGGRYKEARGYAGRGSGGKNAERRDLAKKKQIWKGTGVH